MSTPSPPPYHHHPHKDHSSGYYYFVIAMAAVAFLLVSSNIIVVGCCRRCRLLQSIKRFLRSRGLLSSSSEVDGHISTMIPVSKYKKAQAAEATETDSECSVCLMQFMEGEEVRQLPQCKHSFHAPCIDMWLYSHSSCPLCRANVLPSGLRVPKAAVVAREEVMTSAIANML